MILKKVCTKCGKEFECDTGCDCATICWNREEEARALKCLCFDCAPTTKEYTPTFEP